MGSLHLLIDLLDRQIADREGEPVGKVDDVEFSSGADGHPRVVALLVGPQAYGRRIGGRLGRWISDGARRLSGAEDRLRLPIELVDKIATKVELTADLDELDGGGQLERWLRDSVVARIPGAHDAGE